MYAVFTTKGNGVTNSQQRHHELSDEQARLLSVAASAAEEMTDSKYGHVAEILTKLTTEIEKLVGVNQVETVPDAPIARTSSRISEPVITEAELRPKIGRGKNIDEIVLDNPEEEDRLPRSAYSVDEYVLINDGDDLDQYLSRCRVHDVIWNETRENYTYVLDRMERGEDYFAVRESGIYGADTSI